jgi:hypothetical protein
VSEKEALQSAADEARKAARAARELAGLFDDYAKYLTQPNWRERANELHVSVLNKLRVVKDGLAASDKWVEESDKRRVAQPVNQTAQKEGSKKQDVSEAIKPPAMRAMKRGGKR